MSVRYPAAYRNWRTKRRVLLIIAGIWLCPSILFSVSIFGYGWFSGKGRILQEDECYVQFMTNAYLNMGMYISYYWSTLVLMLYLYYGIYTAAKQLASKSDQKQRRMALLAEMRVVTPSGPDGDDGQGKNDRNNNNNTEAQSVVGMSEAGATVDDSMESRPQRRVSVTRLFSLRNGRLFSLKNILAGDGRLTAGGVHKGAANNAKVAADKAEHRQRSVTLTTPVANNASSCCCGDDAAQSLTQTAAPVRLSATESDAKRLPEAVEEEEGTTTAFTPVMVGESEHFFPFIDESAATSLQEASTKEAQEEKMNVNDSIRGITNPNDDNNNTTPLTSPTIPNNNSFHVVTVPELFSADANNNSLCYVPAESPELDAVNQRAAVDTAASPFTNPFRTAGLSLQLFVHQHRSSSAFPESFSPHSEAVRMDVQVERTNDERFDDVFGGVRRWLGAVGRWERLTLRAQRRHRQRRKSRAGIAGLTAQQRKLSKGSHSRSENRARKALRTITVILGTFTLFWTPFYVLATVYGFCERCSSSTGFQALYTISYLLCYMNSPINPFCYAMANQQFKRAFKKILRGDLRRN